MATYFLGQEAKLEPGLRVIIATAFLHAAMGIVAFMILRVRRHQI